MKAKTHTPKSYCDYIYLPYIIVQTPAAQAGQLRRNQRDIKFIPKEEKDRTPEGEKAIKNTQRNCCSGRRAIDIQLESSNRMTTRNLRSRTVSKIDRTRLNPKLILSQKLNDLAKAKLLSYYCNQG